MRQKEVREEICSNDISLIPVLFLYALVGESTKKLWVDKKIIRVLFPPDVMGDRKNPLSLFLHRNENIKTSHSR